MLDIRYWMLDKKSVIENQGARIKNPESRIKHHKSKENETEFQRHKHKSNYSAGKYR
jgi:hypothetical protein